MNTEFCIDVTSIILMWVRWSLKRRQKYDNMMIRHALKETVVPIRAKKNPRLYLVGIDGD